MDRDWLLGLNNFAIPSPVYRITLNVPLSGTILLLTQTPMFTFTKQRGHGPKSLWTELNWVNMVCCGCESIFFVCIYIFFPLIPCISLICVLKAKLRAHFTMVGCVCLSLCVYLLSLKGQLHHFSTSFS